VGATAQGRLTGDNGGVPRSITVSAHEVRSQRPAQFLDDEHFAEVLAQAVIEEYTEPGDRVLDPFAGFGTTLLVAHRLGRTGVGLELDAERAAFIGARMPDATVLQADARALADLDLGSFRLCLTSPPYMTICDHPENPLTAYQTQDGWYPTYLAQLGSVFVEVARLIEPGGHVVINVADLHTDAGLTPLIDDVSRVVGAHLVLRDEIEVQWDTAPPWMVRDRCLVFQPSSS
jgi:hypothetical protein